MQLAIVHDWLNQMGGAEAVLETLVEMFPRAPIYTSIYWRKGMPPRYQGWDIRTTWLDHAPGIHRHQQPYFALYPRAWSSLNLSKYDLILSNKSGFCHGVRKRGRTKSALHVCYCLAPTRYVWNFDDYARSEGLGRLPRIALKPLVALMRRWDFAAAQQVDHFIAISHEIQTRIEKHYQRESVVIYPPVDLRRYRPQPQPGDYFLIVSRLIPYKRIDLAIQAFNRLGLPLVIAGGGRDQARLEKLAQPNIQFLGRVPEADLPDLIARCRAFVFPGYEDFGITPVEAQACGRPVIAFGAGGALDTVIDCQTGVLFRQQTVDALIDGVRRFNSMRFDPQTARSNAERFSTDVFKQNLGNFLEEKFIEYQNVIRAA
jgi:glycosyltransferase involved in cell wall biosynthesis